MFPDWKTEKKSQQKSSNQSVNEEEDHIHDPQKKRIIVCLYIISLLIYVIIMSFFISYSWNSLSLFKTTDQFYFANQVAYQWKKGFIIDIQVSTSTNCPEGYEHGINYQWPGTSFGCFCQLSENITFVLEGYCTPSLIQKNCHNMQSQQSLEAHYWKNKTNICIKRSSVSMTTEEKYDPSKHQICGSSHGLVIMPKGDRCPYVNVTFGQPTIEDNKQLIEGSLYENPLYGIFNATSPYSFYTYPIENFRVSEHEFCLIEEDTGLNPDHSDFILLNIERGCAQVGNLSQLDFLTEKEFYQNNANLQALTQIQGFPSPGNWQYNLGFSSIPSWTYSCRHNMDQRFSIENSRKQFNLEFEKEYSTLSIVITIFVGLVGIEFLILAIRKIFHRPVYPVGYKKEYLPWDFFKAIIRYVLDMAFKLIIFGIVFYVTWTSISNWNWFKSAISVNCADGNPQINQYILVPFSELYLNVLQYGVVKIVICGVFIIIDVANFVYMYKRELKYYLVEPDGRQFIDKINQTSKQLNIDNLDWLKKGNEKKDKNIFDLDDERENNEFRVTMAVQNQSILEEQENKKPHIKRKKKARGFLFRKGDEEEKKEEKKEVQSIQNDYNPFMLEDASMSMFGNLSVADESKREIMKERKRR